MAADTKGPSQESGSFPHRFLRTAAVAAGLAGLPSPPLRGAHRAGARATSLPVLRREWPRALPSGESSREDGSSPRAGTATGRAAFREDCWEHRHSPAPSGGASPFQVPPSGSPKPRFPKWRTARTRPCRSSRFPALLGRGPGG